MNLTPLRDRVLLRRSEEEEKTAGGIIIPDTAKEKPMEAKVIAVGPGIRITPAPSRPPFVSFTRAALAWVPDICPLDHNRWSSLGQSLCQKESL